MDSTPIVFVFAGPNGSGKSTVTRGFDIIGEYINADEIKKQKNCSDLTELITYSKNSKILIHETSLWNKDKIEKLIKGK